MRWFKHLSRSCDDERIAAYLDDAGPKAMEAYGFWWMLLEIISQQMTSKDTKCSVTYSLSRWSRLFGCHHHTVSKYLSSLESNGLVALAYVGKKIEVKVPNLVKYRDEYSKKSRHRPDSVRPNSTPDREPDHISELKEKQRGRNSELFKQNGDAAQRGQSAVERVESANRIREHSGNEIIDGEVLN